MLKQAALGVEGGAEVGRRGRRVVGEEASELDLAGAPPGRVAEGPREVVEVGEVDVVVGAREVAVEEARDVFEDDVGPGVLVAAVLVEGQLRAAGAGGLEDVGVARGDERVSRAVDEEDGRGAG